MGLRVTYPQNTPHGVCVCVCMGGWVLRGDYLIVTIFFLKNKQLNWQLVRTLFSAIPYQWSVIHSLGTAGEFSFTNKISLYLANFPKNIE